MLMVVVMLEVIMVMAILVVVAVDTDVEVTTTVVMMAVAATGDGGSADDDQVWCSLGPGDAGFTTLVALISEYFPPGVRQHDTKGVAPALPLRSR